jgi:hypothetical protein
LKVVVGLLVDVIWWFEACSDEEIDPDTAVKLLERAGVVTGLLGDLPARLVEVIAELANEEAGPGTPTRAGSRSVLDGRGGRRARG